MDDKLQASGDNLAAQESLERAVGITCFVSPETPGFRCTIKHRYTDFLVNEILPNGDVLHLTDIARPKGQKRRREDVEDAAPGPEIKPQPADAVANPVPPHEQTEETPVKKQRVEDQVAVDRNVNGESADANGASTEQLSLQERKDQMIAEFPLEKKRQLEDLFGSSITLQIIKLDASLQLHTTKKPRDYPTIHTETIADKARRTEAHVAIREIFSGRLDTSTVQNPVGVIRVKAAPVKGPSTAREQHGKGDHGGAMPKGKVGWNELGGEFLHFTLYKENKDTMEVLYWIASSLKVPVKNFQFAGTKDRRGVTVQRVAIHRVRAENIARLNESARGWRVGGFEYKKDGLVLGELGGNEFLLTLRDCRLNEVESSNKNEQLEYAKSRIQTAATAFADKGFINYYGLQRFGTFTTGTHMVGRRMLKGDLEGAIDAILTYSTELLSQRQEGSSADKVPRDDIDRADAIRIWRDTHDSHQSVRKMPRRFQAESAIIQYLGRKDRKTGQATHEKDWQGALVSVPRNLRLMYVHAYQSFVWNTVASKRWELLGNQVVEGDLVIVGEKDDVGKEEKEELDEDGEPVFHPAEEDSAQATEDSFTRARRLSKIEVESGRYDIFDVVLPLPGFDVEYPGTAIGKFYEDFMASEAGGGMDPHNMRRAWKDVSLSGSYRKFMARPGSGFAVEVREYGVEHGEEQMVETDLDRIGKGLLSGQTVGKDRGAGDHMDAEKVCVDKKMAVLLKMQLGSSQYATMALRELTKNGAANFKPDYSTR